MNLIEFLTAEGFSFRHDGDGTVTLLGKWLSAWDQDVFSEDATIEPTDVVRVYRLRDAGESYRLEVYSGDGPNGIITDWDGWIMAIEIIYDLDSGVANQGYYARLHREDGQHEDVILDATTAAEAREEVAGMYPGVKITRCDAVPTSMEFE